jgi:cold shock CspA family protein
MWFSAERGLGFVSQAEGGPNDLKLFFEREGLAT